MAPPQLQMTSGLTGVINPARSLFYQQALARNYFAGRTPMVSRIFA